MDLCVHSTEGKKHDNTLKDPCTLLPLITIILKFEFIVFSFCFYDFISMYVLLSCMFSFVYFLTLHKGNNNMYYAVTCFILSKLCL